MISFTKAATILVAFAANLVNIAAEEEMSSMYETNVPCTPCFDSATSVAVGRSASLEDCTVIVKVNLFASSTGYFEIEGCDGVNPVLHLTVGRTYLFDQSDSSNWYHLIGFAYEADGAHVAVDELEPSIVPPGSDSTCDETLSCPAPMYYMAGNYTGTYSNIPSLVPIPTEPSDDFGLDTVEPLFFHPLGDWQGYGPFVTALNYDIAYDQDIFYFCHVHAGMTGRVKLLDAEGNMLSTENTPLIPYEYDTIDLLDYECGTYNLTGYEDLEDADQCPDIFVCEDGIESDSVFPKCIQAMNCQMMGSMTTNAVGTTALFCHQMIPHHENAVNMAKSLLYSHDVICQLEGPTEEGAVVPWECDLSPVLYDIINTQNSQIIDFHSALEQLGADAYANCDVEFENYGDNVDTVILSRYLAEQQEGQEEQQLHRETAEEEEDEGQCTYKSGIDCTPCEDTDGDCVVKVGVNLLAGEWGYFIVEGCEGVNPTLELKIGRTYLFDQSDESNWYHLIGFSYEADGAHAGVDELEPSIVPPGSDSACDETLSCPAPMYYMNGTYTGSYSNIPSLVSVPSDPSDDFGLDTVEPLFFHPIGDWQGYGPFVTALNFDDENVDQDIFYFCHVHHGMTGRIKLTGADGTTKKEEDVPEIPYEYSCVSPFDRKCGTYDLEKSQPEDNPMCPETFVCYDGAGTLADSVKCVNSMNCAMLSGMTVLYGDEGKDSRMNDVILFLRNMIPHHRNAVNMARNLLISGDVDCVLEGPVEEGDSVTTACLLKPIIIAIINTQNSQIQVMLSLLEAFGVPEKHQCEVVSDANADTKMSMFGYAIALFAGVGLV